MSIAPLMVDIAGTSLTEDDIEILQHPFVGSLILFDRNLESPEQIQTLCAAIREVNHDLLIAIDQEGGRVQRMQNGVTRLPPMRRFGELYDKDPEQARSLTEVCGWLMATEVLSVGIDFSFAPVLDLDYETSEIIGHRAFHQDPEIAAELALLFTHGMYNAGMAAVGKHFPGHGGVAPDSHIEIPVDDRSLEELKNDIYPFKKLIENDLPAIMPAHIIYSKIDELPAGFSKQWLQTILREQLGFKGAIISDDLSMFGATVVGSIPKRVELALDAGCDMVLICNDRAAVLEALENLPRNWQQDNAKLHYLRGHGHMAYDILQDNPNWQNAHKLIKDFNDGRDELADNSNN